MSDITWTGAGERWYAWEDGQVDLTQDFLSLLLTVPPSQDADPAPSTLLKDYQNVPGIDKVDDVVKKTLIFGNGQQERNAENQERATYAQGRGQL